MVGLLSNIVVVQVSWSVMFFSMVVECQIRVLAHLANRFQTCLSNILEVRAHWFVLNYAQDPKSSKTLILHFTNGSENSSLVNDPSSHVRFHQTRDKGYHFAFFAYWNIGALGEK